MPVTIRGSGQLIVQIAQTVKSDNFTSTTKGSYVAVTGLSVTITPSSASNRMLISANVTTANLNNLSCFFHIYRNGSQITPNGVNTGVTPNSTFSALGGGTATNTGVSSTIPLEFLDSPATTSPVTYQIFAAVGSGSSLNLNVNPASTNGGGTAGGSSSITVMEISG
jgi:hypothetical protein